MHNPSKGLNAIRIKIDKDWFKVCLCLQRYLVDTFYERCGAGTCELPVLFHIYAGLDLSYITLIYNYGHLR